MSEEIENETREITNLRLKELLEDEARNSDIKVKGSVAVLQTPEQRESEKNFEDWKAQKTQYKIIPEFETAHEIVNCLLGTTQHHGLILIGEGGIGKSVLTLSSIKETLEPKDWEYANGYSTPLSLYNFLYENREKRVIILDDVEGIFNNKIALSILKSALWENEGKRICHYASTSDKLTIPKRFVMNSKVILLCNEIPKDNQPSTRAMISRTMLYKVNFSFGQKIKICETFIDKDTTLTQEQKDEIKVILLTNVTEATKDFNFRTLRKLIAFVQYNPQKAEKLFIETTEMDEDKSAYLHVIKLTPEVKAQIILFMEQTGKSRATFFRIKRNVKVSSK